MEIRQYAYTRGPYLCPSCQHVMRFITDSWVICEDCGKGVYFRTGSVMSKITLYIRS